ncbi:hypothetical protein BC938DRAFT_471047 [Jimgerdemannia flammicorona]|uniref:Uncharacterized protein n=1 Tax=Jimgerdemannia flammicorona TaxID=994334 RepID=A0A433Q8X5_9FUNG|nr:hypothetical protein BC938DRAFT_471047 [Jimgerdemannia flammicorona]
MDRMCHYRWHLVSIDVPSGSALSKHVASDLRLGHIDHLTPNNLSHHVCSNNLSPCLFQQPIPPVSVPTTYPTRVCSNNLSHPQVSQRGDVAESAANLLNGWARRFEAHGMRPRHPGAAQPSSLCDVAECRSCCWREPTSSDVRLKAYLIKGA